MKIGELIAFAFDDLANLFGDALVGIYIQQNCPVSRIRPYDQLAMTQAPTMPASGSSKANQTHGKTERAEQMLHPLSQHSFLPTALNDVPDPP